MEHQQKGIAKKRERHYRESRQFLGVACIVVGSILLLTLVLLWSQYLFPLIFNSRLLFHLIIDRDDYATCSSDFQKFILNDDSPSTATLSFYFFNISNPADVVQRGERPHTTQVGPYAYSLRQSKYEIGFDVKDQSTLSYKEASTWTVLPAGSDACRRKFLGDSVSCSDPSNCVCQSEDDVVTVINPLFAKTLWTEGGTQMVSYLSQEVFFNIRSILENEFIEAIRNTLVPVALQEVAALRLLMQSHKLMTISLANLTAQGTTTTALLTNASLPSTCGLGAYGIAVCPWSTLYPSLTAATAAALAAHSAQSLNTSDFPSLAPLLVESNSFSILNEDTGLPRWIGIAFYLQLIDSNILPDLVATAEAGLLELYNQITVELFNASSPSQTMTPRNWIATTALVNASAAYLSAQWLNAHTSALSALLATEFLSPSSLKTCSPSMAQCMWPWGVHSSINLTVDLVSSLVDVSLKLPSNGNSMYLDTNSARYFNVYRYCTDVRTATNASSCSVSELSYTANDATIVQPSLLWATQVGYDALDQTDRSSKFLQLPASTQQAYMDMGCDLALYMFAAYPQASGFHDDFVIKYINRHKEAALDHEFSVDNMAELGWAQFGSGSITQAVLNVRSVTQIVRNGQWYIGDADYFSRPMELSSWSIIQGFAQARIYNVSDAQQVLYGLAGSSKLNQALRSNISHASTTFVGDGSTFINHVGAIGDVAFIIENNNAVFYCSEEFLNVCNVLNIRFTSSYTECLAIETIYQQCLFQLFVKNYWVTNCALFQTSLSNPTNGIQCDKTTVLDNRHPYSKSFGNALNYMVRSITLELVAETGLICSSPTHCKFDHGGPFITKSVKELLFEGFSDPLIIKYLNMKHQFDNISFECLQEPLLSVCGKTKYSCGPAGLKMKWTNGYLDLAYGLTPNKQLFQEYFYFSAQSELLNSSTNAAVKVLNPIWAAYPAQSSNDTDFLEYYNCQGRVLFGPGDGFSSCSSTVDSGRVHYENLMKLRSFHGNASIMQVSTAVQVKGTADVVHAQELPLLWKGFRSYPYSYLFKASGQDFHHIPYPTIFDARSTLSFTYSQTEILAFMRDLTYLPANVYTNASSVASALTVQRFSEDLATWSSVAAAEGSPHDSYSMPYRTPAGMASILHLAGFPVVVGTAQNYGNQFWGGFEYDEVTGMSPNEALHRSFVDKDAVSGRALRSVNRKQLLLRLERGPLLENLVSSEGRCVSPTRDYAKGAGYGCTLHTPLLWTEEARVMAPEVYEDYFRNTLLIPERAKNVLFFGAVAGSLLVCVGIAVYLYEDHYRRKFYNRVYID